MIDYSLYLCTNSEMNNNHPLEYCVEQAIIGGVTIIQIREKEKNYNEFFEIAFRIKKVTDKYNIPLIINDNIEIAINLNADGLHIGQNDISCLKARKLLGCKKIIGVTVTNLDEAKRAIESGASYLGVGAIYKSKTKSEAVIVGVDELQKIVNYSSIPVVVIGGINKNTIPMLENIKIDGYAMIRPILEQEDIVESTKVLKKLVDNNKKKYLDSLQKVYNDTQKKCMQYLMTEH